MADIEYLDNPNERAHSDHAPVLLVMKDMDKLDSDRDANGGPADSAERRKG